MEPNVDGGSTKKCKKNIASIIFTSMLAGLTDTKRESISCNSFALGDFFIQVSESVDILKPASRWFFV